jgi:gas vesicle protein
MAKRHSGKWAIGALTAAAAGYVAGVLTAPKSGKETRKDLQAAAGRALAESEKILKQLHNDLDKLLDDAADRTKPVGVKAKRELDKALKQAAKVKDKARAILSAVHEGEATNKDLDKAVKEARAALAHLKKFLSENAKTK